MFDKIFNTRFKKVYIVLFSFVVAILVSLGTFFSGLASVAFADVQEGIDESYVMDDLEGLTIAGEKFDVANYKFDKSKKTQVLSFVEFAYSTNDEHRDLYGLYVYVYNPQKLVFANNINLNSITLSFSNEQSDNFDAYSLKLVNYSIGDIEGLFYKFKVILSTSEKNNILSKLSPEERTYNLGELQLLTGSNFQVVSYPLGRVFTYTGFAKGMDETSINASTLSCITNNTTVISPTVGLTSYGIPYSDGTTADSHNMIYSAYFSVPNKFLENNFKLTEMHGKYLDAKLKPSIYVEDEEVFADLYNFLGKKISVSSCPEYFINSVSDKDHWYYDKVSGSYKFDATRYFYNVECAPDLSPLYGYTSSSNLNPLYFLYNDNLVFDGCQKTISSEVVMERMLNSYEEFGGELVAGKYSSLIFDDIADDYTEFYLNATDEVPIDAYECSDSFFERLFSYRVKDMSVKYDGIKAIKQVEENDILGKSSEEVCNSLYVAENDYSAFRDAYNEAVAKEETLFLFRYRVAPYLCTSAEVWEFYSTGGYKTCGDAYILVETLSLGFDVIDLSFFDGNTKIVVPVSMSPLDHVPSLPIIGGENNDAEIFNWLKIILIVIVSFAIVWILNKIGLLPYIMKGVQYILLSPYYLFKWIFGGGSSKKRYKKKRRR